MNIQANSTSEIAKTFFDQRIIFLGGVIDDRAANNIVAQLLILSSDSDSEITLYINSPGGNVSSGLAIFDTIQHIDCSVRTVGIGLCASMGAFLLCAGTPGRRCVLPNTQVLIHQPLGGTSGQATDIAIAAQHILKTRDRINRIMAERTGHPLEDIQRIVERDSWMWGPEAVRFGLADEVITPPTP